MKRIIVLIVGFLTMFCCVSARAEQSDSVASVGLEPIKRLYLQPYFGVNLVPDRGALAGASVGYIFNCGLGLEGQIAFRRLLNTNVFQAGVGVNYEFPRLKRGYPIIGGGAGVIVDMVHANASYAGVDPVLNYRLGYSFRIVPGLADLGFEYRGDLVFLTAGYQRMSDPWGTVLEHSLRVLFRLYLGN